MFSHIFIFVLIFTLLFHRHTELLNRVTQSFVIIYLFIYQLYRISHILNL